MSVILPYELAGGTVRPQVASATSRASNNWVNRATPGDSAAAGDAHGGEDAASKLRWRTPHQHLRRKKESAGARGASKDLEPDGHATQPGEPQVASSGAPDGSMNLLLVRPANFDAANPLDDPFEDRAPQSMMPSGKRPDQSVLHRTSPPRLMPVPPARPIGDRRCAESVPSPIAGASGQSELESEAIAQAQPGDPMEDLFDFDRPERRSTQDPDELDKRPVQPGTDRAAPPAPDGLGSEDLPDRLLIPDVTPDSLLDSEPYTDGGTAARERLEMPCDRIYEKRNCCAEDEECRESLEILRFKPITTISLDIVPPFDPHRASEPDAQRARLSQSEARVWKGRKGDILASGRFTDFRDGLIYVTRDDGTVASIPYAELGDDELCFVNAWWNIPTECRLSDEAPAPRQWQPMTFAWTASALCHKPLYFEDQSLERYGHAAGPIKQPLISAAHFVLNLMLLPYNVGIHPPNECMYALGHYRPGSCAPWLLPAFPLSLRGAAAQAGAVAALVPLPY